MKHKLNEWNVCDNCGKEDFNSIEEMINGECEEKQYWEIEFDKLYDEIDGCENEESENFKYREKYKNFIRSEIQKAEERGRQKMKNEIIKWAEEFKGCYADSQSLEYINKKILINHLNNLK